MPDPYPTHTLVGSRGRALRPATAEARRLRAEGLKRCPACGEVKPLDHEHFVHKSARGGRFTVCRECDRAASRARHAANPEPGRRRACQWQKDHPEAVRRRSRVAASRRRARLREAFVEDVDPQVVFERDEGVCGVCKGPVDRREFDIDHQVPLALGGEHSYANVRVTHPSCNRRRGRTTALAMIERRR